MSKREGCGGGGGGAELNVFSDVYNSSRYFQLFLLLTAKKFVMFHGPQMNESTEIY